MAVVIHLRRDTAAAWTAVNPVLASGEEGYETDTGKRKVGDGATAWTSLTYVAQGFTNPMTTQDDLILGGPAGAPGRLAKGTDGQVLTVDPTTHHLLWATPATGFANPMTTTGDMIYASSGSTPARLAIGGANALLHGGTTPAYSAVLPADLDVSADNATANATTGHHGLLLKLGGGTTNFLRADGSWAAPSGSSSPLTTKGDVFGRSTVDARIPVGTDGQVLTADSTQALGVKWSAAAGGAGPEVNAAARIFAYQTFR